MESFPKQTYRNRCTITTPDGPLTLSIPVKRADSKQLTRDVEISYQQRWQHQHWIALTSAYKRTPYFDYYADFFRPFYEKETKFLVDFNEKIHEVIVELMKNNASIGVKKDNINNLCAAPTLRLAEKNNCSLAAEQCWRSGNNRSSECEIRIVVCVVFWRNERWIIVSYFFFSGAEAGLPMASRMVVSAWIFCMR
mgnify:CR=1 FL=1